MQVFVLHKCASIRLLTCVPQPGLLYPVECSLGAHRRDHTSYCALLRNSGLLRYVYCSATGCGGTAGTVLEANRDTHQGICLAFAPERGRAWRVQDQSLGLLQATKVCRNTYVTLARAVSAEQTGSPSMAAPFRPAACDFLPPLLRPPPLPGLPSIAFFLAGVLPDGVSIGGTNSFYAEAIALSCLQ